MSNFTMHTLESAPADSQPLLKNSVEAFGMLPNLHAVMAEAPTSLKSYQQLHENFLNTSFDAEEKTVVWQTINVEHNCHYCVPAHTGIAKSMGVDDQLIEALTNGTNMPNEKLQALHNTTLAVVRGRGVVDTDVLDKFYAAGYSQKHLLEIVVGLAQKVMSNYVNHFADTPVDEPFKKFVK